MILETDFGLKLGVLYSILYNRGVYPEESFVKVKKYGLPMLLTQDEGLKSFLANLTSQLSGMNISFWDYLGVNLNENVVVGLSHFDVWILFRMAGVWQVTEGCSGDHEQGYW